MIPRCDVAVVGGGPAGSSCAWALRRAGAQVVVLDAAPFPRQKVCAGWVTPRVFRALELDPEEYRATGLVLQDIRAFKTGIVGRRHSVATRYDEVVSYAIRRIEFDDYLLRRAGVRVLDRTRVTSIRRDGGAWLLNDTISAAALVGAGGHFCPVARLLNPDSDKDRGVVVARELEAPIHEDACGVDGLAPELFFCRDLDGYGWCVRKQGYVNIGFGRRGSADFQRHVDGFAEWLRATARLPPRVLDWKAWKGHAYRIRRAGRRVRDERVLLAGDAAGLAWPESGEGIAPAVESGIAAAHLIAASGTAREAEARRAYDASTAAPGDGWNVPIPMPVSRALLRIPVVARLALDRWFLRVA
ncbi:MAG TPA: NAD(P)/FAD-dependent oxidoreductase [Vicinamibacterales bacterium]|jgi:flavin-dependent dehydrogenase|nr:NAD(P)/FAD-dependent oxidoreductase [Vicinamibacterales bacterium]